MDVGASVGPAMAMGFTAASVTVSFAVAGAQRVLPRAAQGARASASVTASEGAFSGLWAPRTTRRRLDPRKLVARVEEREVLIDDQTIFDIGGRAVGRAVEGNHNRGYIRFDEE